MNQENESLFKTFFQHQLETRNTKDWASQIVKDLNQFGVTIPIEEISNIPKEAGKLRKKINHLNLHCCF